MDNFNSVTDETASFENIEIEENIAQSSTSLNTTNYNNIIYDESEPASSLTQCEALPHNTNDFQEINTEIPNERAFSPNASETLVNTIIYYIFET